MWNRLANSEEAQKASNDGCCGLHTDCEKGLRILRNEALYYNDEELDAYKGIAAEDYTDEQAAEIREVFETLLPQEISDWCCAMQARGIALPQDVREEAMLLLADRA